MDYYVGIDRSLYPTDSNLKDPLNPGRTDVSASLAASVGAGTYNAAPGRNTVSINVSSVTIDGYDFGLHGGIGIEVNGSNVTVSNCKFTAGVNLRMPIRVFHTPTNFKLRQCVIDGAKVNWHCTGTQPGGIISFNNAGTTTVEYCWIRDAYFQGIDWGACETGNVTLLSRYRYNLMTNIGYGSGASRFQGSINGTELRAGTPYVTNASTDGPTINEMMTIFDAASEILPCTYIVRQLTGDPGGSGTYQVSKRQHIASREMFAGGAWNQSGHGDWIQYVGSGGAHTLGDIDCTFNLFLQNDPAKTWSTQGLSTLSSAGNTIFANAVNESYNVCVCPLAVSIARTGGARNINYPFLVDLSKVASYRCENNYCDPTGYNYNWIALYNSGGAVIGGKARGHGNFNLLNGADINLWTGYANLN